MYTVRQVADLAGITPRTLHHYDSIGLFKPSFVAENGYRYYSEESLLQLQQILFFRELGFDLDHIRRLMGKKDFSVVQALKSHRSVLLRRIERLSRLLETVDKTIAHHQGGRKMTSNELFVGLSDQEKAYAEEAIEKWDPEIVKESYRRYALLTDQEKRVIQEATERLNREWVSLIGTDPHGQPARVLVERWTKTIEIFWKPTTEGFIGLARMYVEDARFKVHYDQYDPRLALFIFDCVEAYFGQARG